MIAAKKKQRGTKDSPIRDDASKIVIEKSSNLAPVKQMSLDEELKELLAEEKRIEFEQMKSAEVAQKNGKYDQCWRLYDELIKALSSNQKTINVYKAKLLQVEKQHGHNKTVLESSRREPLQIPELKHRIYEQPSIAKSQALHLKLLNRSIGTDNDLSTTPRTFAANQKASSTCGETDMGDSRSTYRVSGQKISANPNHFFVHRRSQIKNFATTQERIKWQQKSYQGQPYRSEMSTPINV